MKKKRMRKTAEGLGMLCAAGLVLILLGCQDPVTELRYVDREVLVPTGIRIETAADLAKIGIDPEFPANGEYYLGEDIDLAVLDTGTGGEEGGGTPFVWRPIGSTCKECGGPLISSRASSDNQALPISCINEECVLFGASQPPFSGIFHGNGKKISGLVLSGGTAEEGYAGALYSGLFGYITGAYIHDLTIELANTKETPVVYSGSLAVNAGIPHIAALAGFALSSRIEDITLTAKEGAGLYVTLSQSTTYIGGAVGQGRGTALTRISSAIPLNSTGTAETGTQYLGGIAGSITSGEIASAKMTGSITIDTWRTVYVGGIVGGAGDTNQSVKKSVAVFETLKIHTNQSGTYNPAITAGGIAGQTFNLTDCEATFTALEIDAEDAAVGAISLGGLMGGSSAGTIENSHAQFETIGIALTEDTAHKATVYVGGLSGRGSIARSSLKGEGSITLKGLNTTSTSTLYVGGLVGAGDISRSRIPAGIAITVETGTSGIVYAGGLTGDGTAEYSFIGSKEKPGTVQVEKSNSTGGSSNQAFVGGISGRASISDTKPFHYNYAFCNVSLKTQGARTSGTPGQSVGGLAGSFAGSRGSCEESYAGGTVTLTSNYSGTEGAVSFNAGGIAGYTAVGISKSAALNGVVTIDGTTTTTKNWRRIAYPGTAPAEGLFSGNITTVTQTIPSGYTPENARDTSDGELKTTTLGQGDFGTNGLGWDFTNTWEWNSGAGLPLLKASVFEDQA
jgi:hypothetical protein